MNAETPATFFVVKLRSRSGGRDERQQEGKVLPFMTGIDPGEEGSSYMDEAMYRSEGWALRWGLQVRRDCSKLRKGKVQWRQTEARRVNQITAEVCYSDTHGDGQKVSL